MEKTCDKCRHGTPIYDVDGEDKKYIRGYSCDVVVPCFTEKEIVDICQRYDRRFFEKKIKCLSTPPKLEMKMKFAICKDATSDQFPPVLSIADLEYPLSNNMTIMAEYATMQEAIEHLTKYRKGLVDEGGNAIAADKPVGLSIQKMNLMTKEQLKDYVKNWPAKKVYEVYQVAFDYNYVLSADLREFMNEFFAEHCPFHPVAVHPYDTRSVWSIDLEHETYWLKHDPEYLWWVAHNRSKKLTEAQEEALKRTSKKEEVPLAEALPKTYSEFVEKVNGLIRDYWKTEEEDPDSKEQHRTRVKYFCKKSVVSLETQLNNFSKDHNCFEYHFDSDLYGCYVEYNYAGVDNWRKIEGITIE